jgi:hypothetical protein
VDVGVSVGVSYESRDEGEERGQVGDRTDAVRTQQDRVCNTVRESE